MANKIVKDSQLPIFVKQIAVPQGTAIGTLVRTGAKAGLTGDTPRLAADDGLYYTTVDTAALIRVDAVAIAFLDGAPVYLTSALAIAAASATGSALIGYADRAKGSASGPLHIQLDPSAKLTA